MAAQESLEWGKKNSKFGATRKRTLAIVFSQYNTQGGTSVSEAPKERKKGTVVHKKKKKKGPPQYSTQHLGGER